jgi:hypothetical protein
MTLRVEVQPGGTIELMRGRVNTGEIQFLYYTDIPEFLQAFYHLFKEEVQREADIRFTSELDIECQRLLKLKLEERTNAKR